MYKFPPKPCTLARFEPGIFCSVGGRDDHYATAPVQYFLYIVIAQLIPDHASYVCLKKNYFWIKYGCLIITRDRCYDFKKISIKNGEKIAFLFKIHTASVCELWIIALVFKKNANVFAENWRKSQKIVIITSTPDHVYLIVSFREIDTI
jgi:hypothetical protein